MSRKVLISSAVSACMLAAVLIVTGYVYAGDGGSCPLTAAAMQKAEGEPGHMNKAMHAGKGACGSCPAAGEGKACGSCAGKADKQAGCGACRAAGEGKMCDHCAAKKSASHRESVATALAKVEAAQAALKAGDTDKAAAALAEAQTALAKVQVRMRPAVVNATCPMMAGNKVKADAPAKLYREFRGKGVAFCCGKCPAAWDKLSDEQKAEKLAAATTEE